MRYLNIHPPAVRAGRTLLLTLAVAATSYGAATSAVASPPAVTAAAAPGSAAPASATGAAGSIAAWSYIRLTCRTLAAGEVCLGLMGNGQPNSYRLQYVIRPKAGQWIRRVALASWQPVVADVFSGPGTSLRSDGYRQFCTGPCPEYRSNASWQQATPYFRVYTFLFDTPQGRYDVSAGATVPGEERDSSCTPMLWATSQLTTTNDGNVWLRRSFRLSLRNPIVARLIENDRSVYTKTWSGNAGEVQYTSPQLYRPWDRVRNPDGSWAVAGPRAYAFYRDYSGEVQRTFTSAESGPVC